MRSLRPPDKRLALHPRSRRRDRKRGAVRLGLLLAGVFASAAIGLSSAGAISAERAAGRPELERSLDDPGIVEQDLAEQRARREGRRAWRRSAEGVAELQRSRTRHRGLSHDRAVALARDRFPRLFSRADRRLLPLRDDQEVHRYTGERTAVVTSRSGDGASLVDSGLPLRARDEAGVLRPIDLDLERIPGGWKSANGSIPLRFNDTASEALAFPGDYGVGISGSRATGARTSNEIFFTDVYTDTDVWFGPIATGGRLAFQLRSEDAPEELRLTLRDAPGVVARRQAGGAADGVDLLRDGERVGAMSAPVAFDADHESIPVDVRIEGHDVIVRVPHHGRSALYPIAVDPVFENQDSWKYGNGNFVGWGYYESVPQFTYGEYHPCCGSGLWVARNANQWFHNTWMGELHYGAFNDFSYIHRADFMHVRHISPREDTVTNQAMHSVHRDASYATTFQHYYNFNYPFDWTGSYYSVCADGHATEAGCDENVNVDDSRGNYVLSRIQTKPLDWSFPSEPALVYWGGARIWLSDWEPPFLSYFEAAPAGWVDDVPAGLYNGPNEAHVRYDDRGLGMWDIWMDVPGMARQHSTDRGNCNGARSARCPISRAHTFSYAGISEGIQTVTATAEDVLGRRRSDTRTLRIDRSSPDLTLSGPLKDREGQELPAGRHDLRVDARDGVQNGAAADRRSGVREVDVRVDGVQVDERLQLCATDSCPLSFTWTFDTQQYPGGEHLVEVTARDGVGRTRTERVTARTRCCSSIPYTGGVTRGSFETAFADVDGDGLDDAIRRDRLFPDVRVGLSDGTRFGTFDRRWSEWSQLLTLAAQDVTGDGRADLVGRNTATNELFVARSTGSAFEAPQRFATWSATRDLHVADMDGDGRADAVGRDEALNDVWVAYSNGSAFEPAAVQTRWSAGYDLHVADVNADGAADLIGRNAQSGDLRVAVAGDVGFEAAISWGRADPLHEMQVADMNGDDRADVVTRFTPTGVVRVMPSEDTRFGAASVYEPPLPPDYDLALSDPTGEGQFDVIGVSRGSTGQIRIHPTDVAEPFHPETEELTSTLDIAYYDGDELDVGNPVVASSSRHCKRPGMQLMTQDEHWITYGMLKDRVHGWDVAFERAKNLGACFIRMMVSWGTGENENGTYYIEQAGNVFDQAIDRAHAEGFRVYLTVTGAVEDCASYKDPETQDKVLVNPNGLGCKKPGSTGISPDAARFGRFAERVVNRYKGKVRHYGIWNEPNVPGFLKLDEDRVIPARTYGQLYAEAYRAISNKGHRVRILIGELSSRPRGKRYEGEPPSTRRNARAHTPVRFLANAVEAAAAELRTDRVETHGVAWHPYQHARRPSSGKGADFGIGRLKPLRNGLDALFHGTANSANKRLVAPGSKRAPLYLTEFGYLNRPRSAAGKDRHKEWHPELRRASWWEEALDLALAHSRTNRRTNLGPRLISAYQLVEIYPQAGTAGDRDCSDSHPKGGCILHTHDSGLVNDGRKEPPFGEARGVRPYGRAGRSVTTIFHPQPREAFCVIANWSFRRDPELLRGNPCAD